MASAARTDGWTPTRSAAGRYSPWLIVAIISLPTFMEVLDTSIANDALDHIAGSLSVSTDQATWVLTSYLVANAVIIPLSGWLSDAIGRKRYFLLSIALFTFASLLCGLSPNLTTLVIARVLQGIGGGGLAPVEQSIIADTFPPEKRGMAFAAFAVVVNYDFSFRGEGSNGRKACLNVSLFCCSGRTEPRQDLCCSTTFSLLIFWRVFL